METVTVSSELSRRAFLRIVAATGAAAAGCSKPPTRELMPYLIPDEDVMPGVPSFYASACGECPAGCGVVARVREGRVIKLEGNPEDPIGGGSLCARGQAALQGLYNPDRLAAPHARLADGSLASLSWQAGLQALADRLRAAAAAGPDRVAFLGPSTGPTVERMVDGWLGVWRSHRRVAYEPFDDEPARVAGDLCFGRRDLPVYRLDAGEVVLAFGADFLETWRSPVELTRQYARFRTPQGRGAGLAMGRTVYIGPRFGLTAANGDEWLAPPPGTEAWVVLGVLHVVARGRRLRGSVDGDALLRFTAGYDPATVEQRTGVPAETLRRMAAQFAQADGAVALAGTTDPATHIATALLNAVTGNVGKTVCYLAGAAEPPTGGAGEVNGLLTAIDGGAIDVLVVAGANPVFSDPRFADALQRVGLVVWCGQVPDETAVRAELLLPCHHRLETWSDAAPRAGVTVLGQPVMQPVFDTLALGDILLATVHAAGASADALPWADTRAAVEATWRALHADLGEASDFATFWQQAREAGGLFQEAPVDAVALRPEVLASPLELPASPSSGLTLVAVPHIFLYDGRGADNPWLQEIPEPVAQIVWDSWAEVHPGTAARLAVGEGGVVELRSDHGSIEVPVHLDGRAPRDVVIVPLGQGHTAYGRYASGRGANPWAVLPPGARMVAVTARATGAHRPLVSPLALPDMLGRPIVEAVALRDLRRGVAPERHGLKVPEPWQIRPAHVYPDHQWGMTIDLNACTGCSACVAACYAENNLPVVGREEVARGHIMSWIRIERYVPTGPDAPPLYLMPMLCQQCDHAPCEAVCPVYASSHTAEGLNAQVYNRCIGTRYCENNCPYKVRRFNWFEPQWPPPLHLQLNPDVTVRGAGVMEKCTFCIQRIRAVEMDARAERRPVRDGEIIPACAQACPARAITFGDMLVPDSAMMRRRADHAGRGYRALEEMNTAPAIDYLRQVYRGPEEV
jgi:molybdopterin-containing oxidoreductase family iron-sulfur binding subunit